MPDAGATPEVRAVSSDRLEGDERKAALELVEDIQENRDGRRLKASEVPHVLLEYQADWNADSSPIRLAEKSRRIGYSWGCLAAESVIEAGMSREAGGMDQHYMGYNQAMAAEYIGDCAYFAKAFGQAIGAIDVWRDTVLVENERRDILRYMIRLASGFTINALSSNPFNWRGKQGHARIDEAAFHENLREVIKGALAFRMWGGRVDIVSTHNTENNYFFELVRDIQAKKLPWSIHTVSFSDALNKGFFKRVCLIKPEVFGAWSPEAEAKYEADIRADYPDAEDAAEELDCVPKRGSGAYFTRMIMEQCQDEDIRVLRYSQKSEFVLDPERLKKTQDWLDENIKPIIDSMPQDRRTALGQDFGRSGDLSVNWILQEDGPKWRTGFILELRNIPFDCQELIGYFLLGNLPLLKGAKYDSRGNGQSQAEKMMQKFGEAFVECVMLTAAWYALWFPKYRSAYENREIVGPKSEDIIQDHRLIVLRDGKPAVSAAKVKGSDGKDRHADSAVAGVLAWAAAMGDGTQPAHGETIDHDPDAFEARQGQDAHDRRLVARPGQQFDGRRQRWA